MPNMIATVARQAFSSVEILKEQGYVGTTAITTGTDTTWPSANLALYVPIRIPEEVTIKRLLWRTGAASSGNYDIGLYDSDTEGEPDSRLASLGSTAFPGSDTEVASNIADQTVGPGLFYMALAVDNTTARVRFAASLNVQAELLHRLGLWSQSSAFPLPATATPVVSTSGLYPMISAVRDA